MAKYPREEISYKKLYKRLDLDRDLGIEWPDVPEIKDDHCRETVLIDEHQQTMFKNEIFTTDELDDEFCKKNGIDVDVFSVIFQALDRHHIDHVFCRLDQIKVKRFHNPCDVCGWHLSKKKVAPVVCQGCYLSVHEDCYGVVDTPATRWLCRDCIFHYEKKVCRFCNSSGGAMKKTLANRWAHVVCASLIHGVTFCNTSTKDPIDETGAERLEGLCSICNETSSYLIRCAYDSCNVAYHAGCAAQEVYSDLGNAIVYCKDHDPLHKPRQIISRRNMLREGELYPDLEQEIVLRKPVKFSEPKLGAYLKVVGSKYHPKTGLEESYDTGVLDAVSRYWRSKREKIGYYFEDMFMYPNRFLQHSINKESEK